MRSTAKVCLFALAASLIALPVSAETPPKPDAAKPETAKPDASKPSADVATLLFSSPQWGKAPVGSTITYAFSKKTSDVKFGPPFDDKIVLKLEKGDDDKSRVTEVKMFSGPNSKPAGPFRSDQQNPVLLLVMEENVQELSKLFKANPRYLKNAIRKAWRDNAKIVDTPVEVDGKSVPGTRISVTPFANDAEKDKMMGLEAITYTVDIADSVPGNIARIDIRAPAEGKSLFSETLTFSQDKK